MSEPVRRRKPLQILSILLAAALLVLVIASAGLDALIDALHTLDWRWLLAAYALNVVMVNLMTLRWRILYKVEPGAQPNYFKLLRANLVGIFVNTFLPSMVGGDVYRAVHMSRARRDEGLSGALSVVFVDRLAGLVGLGVVGTGALVLGGAEIDFPPTLRFWVAVLFVGLLVALMLSLDLRVHRLALRWSARQPKGDWISKRLANVFDHLAAYTGRRELLVAALTLSVTLRLVWLVGCSLVGRALGLDIPLPAYLVLISVIELVRMVPVTIQGIGVREGMFVLLFDYYGVAAAEATLLAILIYLLLTLNGLVGGVIFVFNQMRG
jgi:uncharacterized protein (TIRG00374 family)